MKQTKLIGPFKQLLGMQDLPLKGALKDEQLTILKNAGILVSNGEILAVGPFNDLKDQADSIHIIDQDAVCIPGFVDAHTHICFGGSRANDFAMRNSGKSYLEIAKAGGGIWDTVTQTRKASQEDLTKHTVTLANQHLKGGTTTIEVKSGYGLSINEELKMLRAIKEANMQSSVDMVPTCLAAHMVPKDWSCLLYTSPSPRDA